MRSINSCGVTVVVSEQSEPFPTGKPAPARTVVPKEVVIQGVTAQGFEFEQAIDDWAPDVYCLIFRKREAPPTPPPTLTRRLFYSSRVA